MMRSAVSVVLALVLASQAQSLGDLARENRERPKARASRVITNDNLQEPATDAQPRTLDQELARMRKIFRDICADPRTNGGRVLSDFDKRAIDEGVKPLRVRVAEYERIQKKYVDALAAPSADMEAEIRKIL